jgi:hypothetical protein
MSKSSGDAEATAWTAVTQASAIQHPLVNALTPTVQSSGDAHPTVGTAAPQATTTGSSMPSTPQVSNVSAPPGLPPGLQSKVAFGESDLSADMLELSLSDLTDTIPSPSPTEISLSGVVQPAAVPAEPRRMLFSEGQHLAEYRDVNEEVQQYMDRISEEAAADTDSAPASQSTLAAQSLLAAFFINGNTIRDPEQLVQAMAEPIRRRRAYVFAVANRRGVAQCLGYTVQAWTNWYANNPLSPNDLEEAVKQWKHDFPIHQETLDKIRELEELNTRHSKAEARRARNGAFKVYMHEACIHMQLAMTFLSHPPAAVNTLLEFLCESNRGVNTASRKCEGRLQLHCNE